METVGGWNLILREATATLSPDPEGAVVFTFDAEGRPIAWSEDGILYKRSLASVLHGRRDGKEGRSRFVVPADETAVCFGRMLARVAAAPRAAFSPEGRRRLEEILAWTPERLLSEGGRFAAAYEPLGILPPDQYLAIVLQATQGCSWNRCTFCDFYHRRPFRSRTVEEFGQHVRAVGDLLGRGALMRRRIFLADGDALVLSNTRLLPLMAMARAAFPHRPLGGFVDVFAGQGKPVAEWSALREAGLERVQVGLETGHDALLAWLDKPGSAREARDFVGTLKEAGLAVSVILLCGVGGARFALAHTDNTVALIRSLPLAAGDIVYLSPFLEREGSVYSTRARGEGVEPLAPGDIESQHQVFREAVRNAHPGVKAVRYDIREFVY
jgi:radical SAM family protein